MFWTEHISWQMCPMIVALWPFEPWPPLPTSLGWGALTPFFLGDPLVAGRATDPEVVTLLVPRGLMTDMCFIYSSSNGWVTVIVNAADVAYYHSLNIFGMVSDRCYNMMAEVRTAGMVMDVPAALSGWRTGIASAVRHGWLTVAPSGKNHKTLNPWPAHWDFICFRRVYINTLWISVRRDRQ